MARVLKYFLVAFTTFVIGTILSYERATPTTLEEISRHIDQFEGRLVEVETFAQNEEVVGWTIGEPFDKYERMTFIELRNSSSDLDALGNRLASQSSLETYPRIKVRVRGWVEDNCNNGIPCCFGETMTLKQASVMVLSPPEMYSRPKPN